MSNQQREIYKQTWSEEFKKGWSEGYTTALDELSYKIKSLIEEHYNDEVNNDA